MIWWIAWKLAGSGANGESWQSSGLSLCSEMTDRPFTAIYCRVPPRKTHCKFKANNTTIKIRFGTFLANCPPQMSNWLIAYPLIKSGPSELPGHLSHLPQLNCCPPIRGGTNVTASLCSISSLDDTDFSTWQSPKLCQVPPNYLYCVVLLN